MRKLVILPLLTLVLACSDNPLVEPESVDSPDLSVALKKGGGVKAVKLVPLKLKGPWQYGATGDTRPCEDYPGSTPAFIEFEGTGTHLGRFTGTATNCMDYSGLPDVVRIMSQTSRMVAANGDVLFSQGTVNDDPPIELIRDPLVSYSIGPSQITGGTGRFENASGWYMLTGDYSMGPTGGDFLVKGRISSVGSGRR